MLRSEAFSYHDRALTYLRQRRQEGPIVLGAQPTAKEAEAAAAVGRVRLAVAVESAGEHEGRIVLRARNLDEDTLRVVDSMRERGDVPEDTEVEEVGPLYGFGPRDLAMPLMAGVSCAHQRGPRGTLGCFVTVAGQRMFLSANHVIAQENNAAVGDEIVQPAAGVETKRSVAVLHDFEPLLPVGNIMDAAIARVTVGDLMTSLFNGKHITRVRTRPLLKGDAVFKFGQSTEERAGTVLSTTSNAILEMRFADYAFDLQIEVDSPDTNPFGCSGDSGALVYDDEDCAVGILIGGNCRNRTFVTPIARLLARFGADEELP